MSERMSQSCRELSGILKKSHSLGTLLIETKSQSDANFGKEDDPWSINTKDICLSPRYVGHGANASVFECQWSGVTCVAKTMRKMTNIHPQMVSDLKNESQVLSKLRHPNIVHFYGADLENNTIILEKCDATLHDYLLKAAQMNKPIKKSIRKAWIYQFCAAMAYLHARNYFHRDLKPANLLITKEGILKLADFGLAKKIGGSFEKYVQTGETGTYVYMAPEVFLHKQYDEKVDVYSFAMIVYYMETGIKPFIRLCNNPRKVAEAAARGERPQFGEKSRCPKLKALIEKCWAVDPAERPTFKRILKELDNMNYTSTVPKASCSIM